MKKFIIILLSILIILFINSCQQERITCSAVYINNQTFDAPTTLKYDQKNKNIIRHDREYKHTTKKNRNHIKSLQELKIQNEYNRQYYKEKYVKYNQ